MLLRDWLRDVPERFADQVVRRLVVDSRRVVSGDTFVALAGIQHDARQHIPAAIAAGAALVLAEAGGDWQRHDVRDGVPVVVVPQLSLRLGDLASCFHDHPSADMTVLAVTGTNGKTSIANLLAGALEQLSLRTAIIGTLGNGFTGDLRPSQFTTPDPLQLQGLLADFRDRGARCVAMEASSHGLQQGRMAGTRIHTALFTNLTRDHLDYHGDMASYAAAKGLLFQWPDLQAAVINEDDPQGVIYCGMLASSVRCLRYSLDPASDADLVAESVQPSLDGLRLRVRTPEGVIALHSSLLGRFNASNLLAVLGGLMTLGFAAGTAAAALAAVPPVAGRMQCLHVAGRALAVVDYAHTPDALEQALKAAREHTTGQLWCVFGCGGGRDTGKRPQMGRVAVSLADRVVITTDNPREEAPDEIIAHVRSGMPADADAVVVVDRAEAIAHALREARPEDVVLIAGKGHETYQEIMGVRYPFNDADQVRQVLGLEAQS